MQDVVINGAFQLKENLTPEKRKEVVEEVKEFFNVSSFEEEEQCYFFRFLCTVPKIDPDNIKRFFLNLQEDVTVAEIKIWFLQEPDFKFNLNEKEISYKLKI